MSKYAADITLLVISGGAEEEEEWPVRARVPRARKRKIGPSETPFDPKRARGVFTYKAPSGLLCDEKGCEPPPPPPVAQPGTSGMTNDIVRALVFGIIFIGIAYLIKEETDYARPLA